MAVKNLLIRGGADFSGVQKEMAKTQKTLTNFHSNVSGIMKKVGVILGSLAVGKLVKDSLDASSQLEGAMTGLKSILEGQGKSFVKANGFIQGYIKDGLVPLTDAVTAYKNLAARGYSEEQIQTVMSRLKDSAAFGRQASYTLGEAVSSASEGLKNENSILVDNAGVTKNVAKMWEDYAKSIGKSTNELTQQEKIQAEVSGIVKETQWQVGDAAKYTETYAGRVAALNKTLFDIKVNLGNAFMPIANIVLPLLQSLANSLAVVTSIFAQFSQALFGKSSNANTDAKATTKQTAAVSGLGDAYKDAGKAAKGAVAGFDEINNISDNSNSGSGAVDATADGGSGLGVTPTPIKFDTNAPEISAKVQAMADSVKAKVKEITDIINANKAIIIAALGGIGTAFLLLLPYLSQAGTLAEGLGISFGTAFSEIISPAIIATTTIIAGLVAAFIYLYQTNEQFRNDINTIWSDIAKVFEDFWNNTLQPIGQYIINDFLGPVMNAFKTNILPVLADIFVGASKIFGDILNLIISTINNIWGVLRPGMDLIKTIIIDVLQIIKDLWDKHGQDLITNIRNFIKGAQDTFQLIWDNILNPIIKPALEMLTWLWTQHLSGLVAQIGDFIMKCVNGALELYNGFIKPIIDWMVVELGPAISQAVSFIVDVFGTMVAGISDVIQGLFKILGGIVDFIVGVFTGNWSKAWNGVKDIFKGVFDSLYGIVKVPLNLIIDAINAVIRGLNSIHVEIPDWVPGFGGKTFGINIPSIPKLALGGITNGPMVAMIGDNPGGKEVVSPLDKLQDMIASAVGTAMMASNQFSSISKQGDIILQIDGTTFARITNPYNSKETSRIGGAMITAT